MGILVEVWEKDVMENLVPENDFLSGMDDLSIHVEYNTINLAIAGVEPVCLVDNTSWPMTYAQRTDVPVAIPLGTYDTENTLVRNIEEMELAYNKRESVLLGHKRSIQRRMRSKACFAVGPATTSTDTPILVATGADNGSGFKRLTWDDIATLVIAFDDAEIPAEDRHIILSSQHRMDLRREDKDRFKEVASDGFIEGFKIWSTAKKYLPRYHKSTGVKYAYGAIEDANQSFASVAWQKTYMAYALGTATMFGREKDPLERGDIMGFQIRAMVSKKQNKGIAAIYSPAV